VHPVPLLIAAHLFETQLFEQHSPSDVQACVSDLQTVAEHLPLTQLPLQQPVEIVQEPPAFVHVP